MIFIYLFILMVFLHPQLIFLDLFQDLNLELTALEIISLNI
jgi:hypothetical protein